MKNPFSFFKKLSHQEQSLQAEPSAAQCTIEDGVLKDYKGEVRHWVVPEGVRAIASLALHGEGRKTLESVVLPEGIVTIRANTFQNCPRLVSVTLPQSLRSICTKAFANCVNLEDIHFPEGIQSVEADAFLNCPKLVLPERITKKQDLPAAFASAFKTIPDKTVYRGDVLVQGGFDTPAQLIVPKGVRVIGRGAFAFFHLKTVILPHGLEVIEDGAFALCDELERIYLPPTLLEIGEDAFSCCSKLREINFPNSLCFIGKKAFDSCTAMTIPPEVENLMEHEKHSQEVSSPRK